MAEWEREKVKLEMCFVVYVKDLIYYDWGICANEQSKNVWNSYRFIELVNKIFIYAIKDSSRRWHELWVENFNFIVIFYI